MVRTHRGGQLDQLAEREFREYVEARHAVLFRVALLLTGRREDAEDLLQTALSKLALRWTRVGRWRRWMPMFARCFTTNR